MSKRIVLSLLVIIFAITASLGATMAWFTDSATIEPNVFTAGTLTIDVTDSWAENENLIVSNWNPGDCDDKLVELEVTGTKRAFIRMKLLETWTFKYEVENGFLVKDENGDPVELDPVIYEEYSERDAPLVNWDWDEDDWQLIDGWFYYKGMLDPDETDGPKKITIFTEVCLSGDAGNDYQGAVYTIDIDFEAIQVTNNAVDNEWLVYWDEDEEEWKEIPAAI
ncbi:MAG: TasA family protein [Bacillota bacterium]|nr:TasA family protein [Bacillota bacterium]